MTPQFKNNRFRTLVLLLAMFVLSIAVFLVDLQFPLGVAGGVPYAIMVLACYWIPGRYLTIGAGLFGTILTVAGYFLSETSDFQTMALLNRGMALIVIWACVWFVNSYKRSNQELKRNEKRISSIFEAATEGIIITNMDGEIVMVNNMAEELFGYKRQEMVGETIELLVPGRNRNQHKDYRKDYARNPEPRPMGRGRDLYGRKKDGEEFPVEISLNSFSTEEGHFIISYVIDITQRKKAEDDLLKAHADLKEKAEELKQSNAELEQFAYVASHDLQEPLRMVASYTQLLERRYKDKLDEDANDFINYAVDGAHRMQQLLNDLLQFSRVGTRAKPYKKTGLDEVIKASMQNLEQYIDEHDAEISIETDLPDIYIDKVQITQLFQNMIHNAIKFRGDKQPVVTIGAEEQDQDWMFWIADNGIGIDQKHQERIFMIFQRLHSRDMYEGSGIGLAICKKIVERHGGSIWLDSEPGQGATFYFTLRKGLKTPERKHTYDTGMMPQTESTT